MESARGRLLAAETGAEQVEAAQAQVELAEARVAQAQAALDRAALELEYTKVRAEIAGAVAKRTVEPGQMVSPDRAAAGDRRPRATPGSSRTSRRPSSRTSSPARRSRSRSMRSPARCSGHVESVAGGTGSRFSLLPPDNAIGNFTKVVQRVPVLIRIDDRDGYRACAPA